MKFDKRQILKNVGSSWFALGVNVLVGIFLSPYILHRLGDEAFGLWILIFSITGYYGLFDFGIRSSIVRYIAKYSATDEHDELNRLVNTAMFSYGGIGILAMAVTLIATYYVNSIFRMPTEFVVTARWLLLMVGTCRFAGVSSRRLQWNFGRAAAFLPAEFHQYQLDSFPGAAHCHRPATWTRIADRGFDHGQPAAAQLSGQCRGGIPPLAPRDSESNM